MPRARRDRQAQTDKHRRTRKDREARGHTENGIHAEIKIKDLSTERFGSSWDGLEGCWKRIKLGPVFPC